MNSKDQQLASYKPGGELVVRTDVMSRSLLHARSLASASATTGLANSASIFEAIDRLDLARVERIVNLSPSQVNSTNTECDSPIMYAVRKYFENDSYWAFIEERRVSPDGQPPKDDVSKLRKWKQRLWKNYIEQQLCLTEIVLLLCRNGANDSEAQRFLEHELQHGEPWSNSPRWYEQYTDKRGYLYVGGLVLGQLHYLSQLIQIEKRKCIDDEGSLDLTAEAYEAIGDWNSAIHIYERWMELHPDSEVAWFYLMKLLCYCSDNRFRDRAKAMQLANQREPTLWRDCEMPIKLSRAFAAEGNFALALKYVDFAERLAVRQFSSELDVQEEMLRRIQSDREMIVNRKAPGDFEQDETRVPDSPWLFPDDREK